MLPKDGITPSFVREALKRRFWSAVIPFFLVSAGTVFYCAEAPRTYESSTLILIQPQEVPQDYVRSTVTSDSTARLATLKDQVMSRPKLEETIQNFDLYPEMRAKRSMYDAVEEMRKHIRVEVKESKGQRDTAPASFEIAFEGPDRYKVRDVTRAIADLFILDDLKLRERQAVGTSKFLDGELDRMRRDLRTKEELVRRFKEENIGMLPEQMENNYRILAQLQQHLDSLNSTQQQAEDRKVLLQGQLSRLEALRVGTTHAVQDDGRNNVGPEALTLDELRQTLASLKARYTNKHPEVIRFAAMVASAEQEERSGKTAEKPQERTTRLGSTPTESVVLVQREDLLTQLKLTQQELSALAEEKKQTSRSIVGYTERIENGPKIEQMFLDLRRDYQEAVENYQSLLEKKLQAELSENLERTQKGEQFTILEPAYLPQKPSKPNVLKVLALGFMAALGCGLGLAYFREYTDVTFRRREDLAGFLDLPVLVSVPAVHTEGEERLRFLKKTAALGVVLSMTVVLFYGFFRLVSNDPTALPIPVGWLAKLEMEGRGILGSLF